jgi:hypothetical protein
MHGPIMKRVAEAGRAFVVAPAAQAFSYTCPQYAVAAENQSYMAACGLAHGAFGLVNTHWESRYGTAFEMTWPGEPRACDP